MKKNLYRNSQRNIKTTNINECRLCGSKNISFILKTFNKHSQTSILEHFKCLKCETVFIGNKISNEELSNAYRSLNTAKYYSEINQVNKEKYLTVMNNLKSKLQKNASIIDIGTGDGLFINLMSQAGYTNLHAHDIPGNNFNFNKKHVKQIYQDWDLSTIPKNRI